jgi:hypothetical protein
VIRVVRKNFRGNVGPVSRKKQAPKEHPIERELRDILLAHHAMLKDEEKKRLEKEEQS